MDDGRIRRQAEEADDRAPVLDRGAVDQVGAACHEGYQSCFFRSIEGQGETFKVTEPQLQKPEEIYKKKTAAG